MPLGGIVFAVNFVIVCQFYNVRYYTIIHTKDNLINIKNKHDEVRDNISLFRVYIFILYLLSILTFWGVRHRNFPINIFFIT